MSEDTSEIRESQYSLNEALGSILDRACPRSLREYGYSQARSPDWGLNPPLWHTAMTEADWEMEARIVEAQGSTCARIGTMSEPDVFTIRDAAPILGIAAETLRKWVRQGRIDAHTTGGGLKLIPRSELERVQTERGK